MTKVKWYLSRGGVIIAILCAGPFALPLLWMSPSFKKTHKFIITLLVLILTIWLVKASVDLYKLLLNRILELQRILSQ